MLYVAMVSVIVGASVLMLWNFWSSKIEWSSSTNLLTSPAPMMVSAGLTIIPLEELRDYIFMCSSFAASAVTGKG